MRWWLTLMAGCTCQQELAAPELAGPARGAAVAAVIPPEASTVALPITLPIGVIRAQVLQKIPKVLVDKQNEQVHKGVTADIHVERTGEPEVSVVHGALQVEIPVHAHVTARAALPPPPPAPPPLRGKAPPPPPRKGPTAEMNAGLRIVVQLQPALGDGWQVAPNLRLSHRWVSTPVLELGPLRVDVGAKADAPIREKLAEAQRDIEADLRRELDMSGKVGDVWGKLGGAHPIPPAPGAAAGAWLVFEPTALFASPLTLDTAGIHLVAGAAGVMQLVVAEAAPAVQATPLPARSEPPARTGARISTQLRVGWDTLRDTARSLLVGQSVTQPLPTGGEGTATLTAVRDVYPSGSAVAVGVDLRLVTAGVETKMTLWVTGTPAVQGDTLRIVDFQYTADSDRMLVDAANRALSDRVRADVAERLVVPIGEPRDAALAQVNQRLGAGVEEGPGRLRGQVQRAELTSVVVSDEALLVNAAILADLSLVLTR